MSGIQLTVESERLREQVREAYSLAAEDPCAKLPFPVGPDFAASVGYEIEDLPPQAAAVFAGVSNVSMWAPIHPGMVVLDLGCGGGLDTLIATRRAGPAGRVAGLDFSMGMLARARASVQTADFVQAAAEAIPLADESVDLVLVNGIFNLNPRRQEIFAELARVVKPGGYVAGAELVLREPLADAERASASNWFS